MTLLDPTARGRFDPERFAQSQAAHSRLLAKWRAAMDLIGPGPAEPHFQDCRGAIAELDAAGPWADLGSGAGFPGIALAGAYPAATVDLVESRRKRSTFLEKVVFEAKLDNATVRNIRSETLDVGAYVGVISRAYKPPRKVLADASRLLVPGGRVVLLLGSQAAIDEPLGWTIIDRRHYDVGDGQRLRVVLQKSPAS
jgi:16S rRNA (guanine527-N7)-methyltransferase